METSRLLDQRWHVGSAADGAVTVADADGSAGLGRRRWMARSTGRISDEDDTARSGHRDGSNCTNLQQEAGRPCRQHRHRRHFDIPEALRRLSIARAIDELARCRRAELPIGEIASSLTRSGVGHGLSDRPMAFGFVTLGRIRGISLCASDLRRTWGRGADIHGPVAALMLTVISRDALLRMLYGPRLSRLCRRLSG